MSRPLVETYRMMLLAAGVSPTLLDSVAAEAKQEQQYLEQVGWYCAGGHEGHDGERVQRSLRWDDPCAFGVPVYVVVVVSDCERET